MVKVNVFSGLVKTSFFLCCIVLFSVSCTKKISYWPNDVIITQKVVDQSKIPITVLVKYAFSIHEFEKIVEKQFPNIDIVQIGNYTGDMGIAEYERRMKHDDLTDIVMTWPLDVGKQYWADRLIDLSGMLFTGNYHESMLNPISQDGKLYYLPGPAQLRGIVYNKTLFKEKGWQVPKSFDEFVALCHTIEASGIRSIQLGFANSEVLETAFTGYSYGQSFSKPVDVQWLLDYAQGKGSFGDQFKPALDTFQYLINAGIWQKKDLDVWYSDRETMLFTRECAMAEDSVLLARMGYQLTGSTDEFALMPFFTPGQNNDWVRLYMVCYIGLNKHLTEPQNKEKYETVLKLMEYISTPEGQFALAADTDAMYSSLKKMPPPDIPEIEDLLPTLERGRYVIFPDFKNVSGALRSGLAGMVRGDLTAEDVIKLVDGQNRSRTIVAGEREIGSASTDFSLIETGNFITDAMCAAAGTDIALFLDNGKDGKFNGKGVSAQIYRGLQTVTDVMCILPDLKHGERGVLQKITMKGSDLLKTLEYAIPVDNNIRGWFYYFSGLRVQFAPAAEVGNRIKHISDDRGNPIIPDKLYTVAVMDKTVPPEYIVTLEDSNTLIRDVLIKTIRENTPISPSGDGRLTIVQD